MKKQPVLESLILTIRNQKVLLDADIATIYDVPTKALNQAEKRSADRFPEDFIFQLTESERKVVVTNCDRLAANTAILKRLAEIDKTLLEQDRSLGIIWQQIHPSLTPPPAQPKIRIGFHSDEEQ
jgi:hypothetical protein